MEGPSLYVEAHVLFTPVEFSLEVRTVQVHSAWTHQSKVYGNRARHCHDRVHFVERAGREVLRKARLESVRLSRFGGEHPRRCPEGFEVALARARYDQGSSRDENAGEFRRIPGCKDDLHQVHRRIGQR